MLSDFRDDRMLLTSKREEQLEEVSSRSCRATSTNALSEGMMFPMLVGLTGKLRLKFGPLSLRLLVCLLSTESIAIL
jgi:hypothetical protein